MIVFFFSYEGVHTIFDKDCILAGLSQRTGSNKFRGLLSVQQVSFSDNFLLGRRYSVKNSALTSGNRLKFSHQGDYTVAWVLCLFLPKPRAHLKHGAQRNWVV